VSSTRSTRAVLASSTDEFADAAEPVIAHAAEGGTPTSILAVKVDSPDAPMMATGKQAPGYIAALREQVVELIRRNLRGSDVVAPAAHEEVFVLLRGAAREQGYNVAGRLCSAIRSHTFAGNGTGDRARTGITASMGVASAPHHGKSFAALSGAARVAASFVSAEGGDGSAIAGTRPGEAAYRALDIARFVGRSEELASLRRWLDEAIAGSPGAVAVIGESGSGRAALLRQLAPEVRLRGGSLVIARARAGSVVAPYGIWTQVLQALRRLPDAPERAWQELAHLDPGISPSSENRAGSKYRLLEQLSEYIRLAARSRPLVLVLDQMHWVDQASWDVLDHLLTQLERERILIGLTLSEQPAQTEIAERRRALQRIECYREVRLSRLTRDEAKRWVESAMHRQEVGRELLAYIYRHTEGNPLAMEQLLRCMVEEKSIRHNGKQWEWSPPSELQLPVGVEALIARRLGKLSSPTRDVLATGAVIGREFEMDVLVRALGGDTERVRAAVNEAVSADILQPNFERGGGGHAFSHWKIADAFLAQMPPDELSKAHERIARALEGRPNSAVHTSLHYEQAGCQEDAYRAGMQAATEVESVYAYETASEYLELAARNAPSPSALAEVRARMAELAETIGRYDDAEELCDLAIEWFAGQGNRERALTLRRMRLLARKELGEHAKVTLEALQELDEEAKALGSVRERAEILTMLSQVHGRIGENKKSEELAAECVALAEQLGDDALLAGALNRLAITVEPDSPLRARTFYERALELYQRIGDVRGQARCHSNLGIATHMEAMYDDAKKHLAIAISLARAAGMADLSGTASMNLGVMMQQMGDRERARELFSDALGLFAAVKNSELQLYALFNMANLDRETKQYESGAALYEACASLAQRIGNVDLELGSIAGEGICYLEMGNIEAARVPYTVLEERLASRDTWFQGRELAEALRVRMAAAEGNMEDALRIFDAALSAVERINEPYSLASLAAFCAATIYPVAPERIDTLVERYPQEMGVIGLEAILKKAREPQNATQ
jgi:predicted ATPase